MNQLMNSIDAIKQKISDAEYKQLCDQMMELNTQRKTTKKFYRVWYLITKTKVVEDYDDDDDPKAKTQYYHEFSNKIIQIKAEEVETMRRHINEYGAWYLNYHHLTLSDSQTSLPVITGRGVYYISPKNHDVPIIRIEDIE